MERLSVGDRDINSGENSLTSTKQMMQIKSIKTKLWVNSIKGIQEAQHLNRASGKTEWLMERVK